MQDLNSLEMKSRALTQRRGNPLAKEKVQNELDVQMRLLKDHQQCKAFPVTTLTLMFMYAENARPRPFEGIVTNFSKVVSGWLAFA